jgi:hypothetical protein
MVINKYVIWAVLLAAVVLFLIYRKRIFKKVPSLEKMKNAIVKGDGLDATAKASMPMLNVDSPAGVISNLVKDSMKKYGITPELAASGNDWLNMPVNQTDVRIASARNLNTSGPKMSDIIPGHVATHGNISQPEDIGLLIRNQVLINDLFGKPGCGCNKCQGKALMFNRHN